MNFPGLQDKVMPKLVYYFQKKYVNSKGLKKKFSITWQHAMEIIKACSTCSFNNQTLLPIGTKPKSTQRNGIWEINMFHFAEFGKLKFVHHIIDTYSCFQ